MNYEPNYNDPRVINRIIHAIGFSLGVMSTTKPHPWSTRYIDKYFGNQSHDLSKFLREQLLICTSDRYNKDTGQCKEYLLNQQGIDYLRSKINLNKSSEDSMGSLKQHNNTHIITTPSVSQVPSEIRHFVKKEFSNELETGQFNYNEKSNRLWHNLQSLKSHYRRPIFAEYGYEYNYDIQTCAPTLIMQYSRQLGNDLWMPALQRYIDDKTKERERLSVDTGLDIKTVKVLINALFCGAKVGYGEYFQISELVNHDRSIIEFLKQDQYITDLRNDIKTCWEYIIPEIPRRRDAKTNRLKPISPKDKWHIYFKLECEVMTCIRKFISNNNQLKCFLEHDGWVCNQELDTISLNQYILEQTGFDVKLDLVIHKDKSSEDSMESLKQHNNTHIITTPSVSQVGNEKRHFLIDKAKRKREYDRDRQRRIRQKENELTAGIINQWKQDNE
jgi:ribose 5-phosphate isomerase RpiB